jgi:UTP--glucose-1-phosphate uridylyltransferase
VFYTAFIVLGFFSESSEKRRMLQTALETLPEDVKSRLKLHGFEAATLLALSATLVGDAQTRRRERNQVHGPVLAPEDAEIRQMPASHTDAYDALRLLGEASLRRGEVAFVVMAGGMATRMGGVVKALVPVRGEQTFLDVRLAENAVLSAQLGCAVPLWLMTSDATDAQIRAALTKAGAAPHIETFRQSLSLRLTPSGALFAEADGGPSTYATGHGDLPDALRRSGLLRRFRKAGGKIVWITNLDNLGACVDPAILGWFIQQDKRIAVEVCPKVAGDKGGIPVKTGGRIEVLEEFRLPKDFDPSMVRVFNTNTFLVQADVLEESPFHWTYFEVEKKVGDQVAIQFERLLQEMTHTVESAYLEISRNGIDSRFLPVKDWDELKARLPVLEALLEARLKKPLAHP